jgi:hypothetical protein
MEEKTQRMRSLIGKTPVTAVLPLLQRVAEEQGLRLHYAKEWRIAVEHLCQRYRVTRVIP